MIIIFECAVRLQELFLFCPFGVTLTSSLGNPHTPYFQPGDGSVLEHLQVDFFTFSISTPATWEVFPLCLMIGKGWSLWMTDISVCVCICGCSSCLMLLRLHFGFRCQPNSNNRTMQAEFTIIKGTVETKKGERSTVNTKLNVLNWTKYNTEHFLWWLNQNKLQDIVIVALQPLMTVRTERMRLRTWALTPGSSPKPPTPWSTPQPTADRKRKIYMRTKKKMSTAESSSSVVTLQSQLAAFSSLQ